MLDEDTQKDMVCTGIMLGQQLDETVYKNMELISTAFESLIILSPEQALNVLTQLNEQINEEIVERMLEDREKYKKSLLEKLG